MKIIDALMGCCGIVGAYGFNELVTHADDRTRYAEPEDIKKRINDLVEAQVPLSGSWPRSCAIIFLASNQQVAVIEAEAAGFVRVHEFYNPNSKNQVYIYTRTIAKTKEEWDASEEKKKYNENYQRVVKEKGGIWAPARSPYAL